MRDDPKIVFDLWKLSEDDVFKKLNFNNVFFIHTLSICNDQRRPFICHSTIMFCGTPCIFYNVYQCRYSFKSLMVLFNGKLAIDNHFLPSTLPVLSARCFHPAVLSMRSLQSCNLKEKWSKDKTEITFQAFILVFTQCLPSVYPLLETSRFCQG